MKDVNLIPDPCPFCGEGAVYVSSNLVHSIECGNESCQIRPFIQRYHISCGPIDSCMTKGMMVEEWNKRDRYYYRDDNEDRL